MFKKNQKGFTLIELLIVVAIIAILAAIAIPQFSSYRMKAYHATGEADLRNVKTAEEAQFAGESRVFGNSVNAPGTTLAAAAGSGGAVGALVLGPTNAATATANGSLIQGTNPSTNVIGAEGIGVSNGVNLQADTTVGNASYIAMARHELGEVAYGVDSDSNAIYFVRNGTWAGILDLLSASPATATNNNDDFNGTAGGGAPTANWNIL